jgi:formamidopyrimidine-DNA glycosylase
MPELPEVETVRRGLAPVLEGARLCHVETRRPDLRFAFPERFAARLTGARVTRLGRRAKYLVAELDTGDALIAHLGMSGRFTIETPDRSLRPGAYVHGGAPDPRHDHVLIVTETGTRITYNDPRRFGFMDLVSVDDLDTCAHFARMGPEPASNAFSGAYLTEALKGRKTPIKSALLDQSVVAGLGNIYVCEALFRAGVSPKRLAASVAGKRAERLTPHIRDVIAEAIEAGGSSLKDFAATDGALGYFQHRFSVYDREGQPCPVCKSQIRRIVQSGRSSFYCPSCQR